MPEPLKNLICPATVQRIATQLRAAWPSFPEKRFIAEATQGLEGHELMGRARHVAQALHRALPADFERAAEVLIASLGPPRESTEDQGLDVFLYLPHSVYVMEHGLGHFEASMRAQHALTQRFTAEFSLRPFLERYPRETLTRLRQWTRDDSPHVRRLVSEGTRPRLPWAPRLREFQKDPRPVLALLELLKDDPVLYVRRSVANNLNDIGKDHPDLLLDTCERWREGASEERHWLIRHALRSLVKQGSQRALQLLGYEGRSPIEVTASSLPTSVRLGESVRIELAITNPSKKRQKALVDFAIHFVKASGESRPKVFKGGKVDLPPGGAVLLAKTVSFAHLTTRRHYPGRHRLDALVNGHASSLGSFIVVG
jgi:3-methyladenine DNA glycosylase AlkC